MKIKDKKQQLYSYKQVYPLQKKCYTTQIKVKGNDIIETK